MPFMAGERLSARAVKAAGLSVHRSAAEGVTQKKRADQAGFVGKGR